MSNRWSNLIYDDEYSTQCLVDIMEPAIEEQYPLLIFFHGGGLESGNRKDDQVLYESLLNSGIAVATADYRMYPEACYPDFIEDAAKAVAFVLQHQKQNQRISRIYIGGSSAGAYIAMMLCFNKKYLQKYQININSDIAGFIFDAGQPTTHFNVLRERRLDSRVIRIDEAAPLYYIDKEPTYPECEPEMLFVCSENDIPGRYEQTILTLKALEQFGYDMSRIQFRYLKGYAHCEYVNERNKDGKSVLADLIHKFIHRIIYK